MVVAALPLVLAFLGLFAPPAGLVSIGLFLWLTGLAVVTRLMLTVYHVPHWARPSLDAVGKLALPGVPRSAADEGELPF